MEHEEFKYKELKEKINEILDCDLDDSDGLEEFLSRFPNLYVALKTIMDEIDKKANKIESDVVRPLKK